MIRKAQLYECTAAGVTRLFVSLFRAARSALHRAEEITLVEPLTGCFLRTGELRRDGGERLCAPLGREAHVVRRRVHPAAQRNFPESTDGE